MQTVIFTKKDYGQVATIFLTESVVAIPTDTVMGIGVIASSKKAYEELIRVKGREIGKAFQVVFPNIDMISSYAHVNDKQRKVLEHFLPGPLTVILNKQDNVQDYVTAGLDTIGVRVINDEFVNCLMNELNEPILLTSANMAHQKSAVNSDEVKNIFNGKIRAIVEGEATIGLSSTVVDLTSDKPILIREGKITLEEINKVWEE